MKKITKILIVWITILMPCAILFAQAPDTVWTRTYGGSTQNDLGYDVKQTTDGGYIVTGSNYYDGLWLLKINSSGDTVWTKFLLYDIGTGYSVQQTADGGYIITGKQYSGGGDFILIKTDANGVIEWNKVYANLGYDDSFDVQQTTDGGYILVGSYSIVSPPSWTVGLMKLNSIGDTSWTKTYPASGVNGGGGAYTVQQTADLGYIIGGYSTVQGKNPDCYMIKTDANGDTLWTKVWGSSTSTDMIRSVQQTTDGGYIVSGDTTNKMYLAKYDANGNHSWSKRYSNINCWYSHGYSVQQTTDGGYVTAGFYESCSVTDDDIIIVKTNALGDTLWTKTIAGIKDDQVASIQQTSDGGYILTGTTASFGTGSFDLYLIKLASDGTTDVKETLYENKQFANIYPNPFSTKTTIDCTFYVSGTQLKVYDVLGNVVYQTLLSSNHETLNMNMLSGIYFYEIVNSKEIITKGKFIVNETGN